MDFLKALFGEKQLSFDELVQAINAHNGNEANAQNQIKVGNLGSGEYVGKGKYDSLNEELTGKQTELDAANELINELKKGTKGNEDLQGKITGYETQVADLQKQLAEAKLKSAVKIALLSEKADDIDYITFKLNEKLASEGKTLQLDENEKIKGWDDILSGLKTQLPSHFKAKEGGGIEPQPLPKGSDPQKGGMTRAEFMRKPYAERAAFANENPEAYKEIMNH